MDVATNGFDAAIALDGSVPPDVAIIDLGLPGFNGRNLINQVKKSERLGHIPIIATGPAEPLAPLPDGVVFMKRPCDPEILLNTVRVLASNDLMSFVPCGQSRNRTAL